jgi:hypothetical protein
MENPVIIAPIPAIFMRLPVLAAWWPAQFSRQIPNHMRVDS